jgi:hypothetical protein
MPVRGGVRRERRLIGRGAFRLIRPLTRLFDAAHNNANKPRLGASFFRAPDLFICPAFVAMATNKIAHCFSRKSLREERRCICAMHAAYRRVRVLYRPTNTSTAYK